MRVALVTHRYVPHLGGIESVVHALAKGLSRRGLEVDVLTQEPDSSLPAVSHDEGVTVRRFPAPLPLPRYTISPSLAWHLLRGLSKYDLVHAHNYHELVPLMTVLARPAHLVVTPYYHAPSGGRAVRALRWPHRVLGGPALRRADRIICISAAEAAALAAEVHGISDRLMIIPTGVDVAAIRDAEPWAAERPLVLSVGRLVPYKRVDLLIRAMAGLRPAADLVVAGDGPEAERLRYLAAAVGVHARFVGRVSDEDLHRWLRTASVVVSMSERESFGLTVLEAIAAGARVVASDIPAHRETVGYGPADQACLVPAEASPGLIAAAVDRAVCAGRPNRPPEPIPTWDEMSHRVAEVYRSLTSPGRETPDPRLSCAGS